MILEGIANLFALIWIVGSLASIYFLIQWIRGIHPWWYIALAAGIAWFCKALARELQKESEKALFESTGIDYPQEWFDLPEPEKKENVITAVRNIAPNIIPIRDIESFIASWDEKGMLDGIVNGITDGYQKTGRKKPYDVVCRTYVGNYLTKLKEIAKIEMDSPTE